MSKTRIPQIQALRALAASLVLVFHAKFVSGGFIGVDIFYVISGFLITGLLLSELRFTEKINFGKFYARRAKRLLPSSLIVVVVTGTTSWLLLPSSMRRSLGRDFIAASTYVSNFLFALWQNDYQNLNSTPSPFIHYWSLAVEEQFYLFWPIILLLLYKIGQRKALFFGILVITVLSFVTSILLTDFHPIWSFYILPTRAWELGTGALLVFLPARAKINRIVLWASFLVVAYATLKFNETTKFPGYAAALPVVATALLVAGHANWPTRVNSLAKSRPVQWLGEISYPLYLWHWPVLVIPSLVIGRSLTAVEKVLALVLILLLSELTHKFIEEPLRHRKWHPRRTLQNATMVTALCVLVGIGIYSSYDNSLSVSGVGKFSIDQVRIKPINDIDGCHVHRGITKSPKCEYGDPYGRKTIVLYGDSHAAQWLPALDIIGKKNHIKVVSLTKSACSATELILPLSSQYSVTDCQRFRDNSIRRISALKPTAVITSSYQLFASADGNTEGKLWWQRGESKLLKRIKALTQFPVYLTDTPRPQIDIPDCLSKGDLGLCDSSIPIDATTPPGFLTINPTPWLCSAKCPAIVEKLVAYRDQSHISVAMSEHLAPRLEGALRAHGII
ncbi:unannotated protein [freshwater metagenome]|uniref:Unannotated protein n=1 Tax=freshwater metagenome TaxID=449393 RepID=A0A6J7E4D3_9ZZZZ|nr:acyltransferase family protein [Actinomycetota bacterium]